MNPLRASRVGGYAAKLTSEFGWEHDWFLVSQISGDSSALMGIGSEISFENELKSEEIADSRGRRSSLLYKHQFHFSARRKFGELT